MIIVITTVTRIKLTKLTKKIMITVEITKKYYFVPYNILLNLINEFLMLTYVFVNPFQQELAVLTSMFPVGPKIKV